MDISVIHPNPNRGFKPAPILPKHLPLHLPLSKEGPPSMEPPVRLRLHFHGVLTKSQKSDGLKRCWILLRPDLATVSDLSCHIARSFEIASSSSDGLVLSMDGFVLPSFESTCIFKDKDAVRVNKKGNLHKQAIKIGADSNYMEESEHVKRLAPSSSNLLAIEEFEKEAGGYQSEHEENESGSPGNAEQLENLPSENTILKKKRKHSDKHQSSKRKKTKLSGPAECVMISNNSTEDAHVEENGCCVQKEALLQKSVPIENLPLDTERKSDLIISSEKDNSDTNVLRSAALHKRSARRKKAKRRWLRELANAEKKESLQVALPGKVEKQVEKHLSAGQEKSNKQQVEKHLSAGQEKSNKQQVEKHLSAGLENSNKHTDGEDETVPIVVRPGHIRFEPLGKEQCQQKLQEPTNTIEWNGTTSKKTGKKWGMEKNFKWTGSGKHDSDGGCNAEVVPEVGGMLAQDPVDYEKLMPLSGYPEEGDVIAYRLVELSSSWCPELSSFRVGKVSFFDAVSQKITLVTVPGYPVSPEEKNDGEEMTQFQSMYNEDGSLEADYTSLVNVRIMERSNKVARVGGGSDDAALVGNKGQASCSSTNGQANDTLFPARRPQTDWDEICQALDEKKAQLLKKDSWNTKQASTSGGGSRGSWSYKAVRGCSLGPTIALLRSKNDI